MKVLVVDDHFLFVEGIKAILAAAEQPIEVLSALDLATAIQLITQHPDLALVLSDLRMSSDSDGQDLLEWLAQQPQLTLPVIVVSASEMLNDARRAMRAGARGYVTKSAAQSELLEAIGTVLQGGCHVPEAWRDFFDDHRKLSTLTVYDGGQKIELSMRQQEVLLYLHHGFKNRDIAEGLNITENTVKTHIRELFARLGVKNRAELSTAIHRLGLLKD